MFGTLSSGMVGVSLFYMLSGFVMAWADRDGDTPQLFYRRRFARIYPAYAVAVAIALAYAAATRGISWQDLAAFTLMQSWVPKEAVYFAASAVFWSLSCEAFFYFTFPLVRRVIRALQTRGVWILTGAAAVVSLSVATAGTGMPESPALTWAVVVLPLSRLPEFIIGVGLGAIMTRGWHPRVPVPLAWAVAAAGVLGAMLVPYSLSRYAVTLVPFAVLVVSLASADARGVRTFVRSKWMVKLGVWSYCFYLLHLVVTMMAVSVATLLGAPLLTAVVAALFASVAAAWLLHVAVERPAEIVLRPRGRPRADTD